MKITSEHASNSPVTFVTQVFCRPPVSVVLLRKLTTHTEKQEIVTSLGQLMCFNPLNILPCFCLLYRIGRKENSNGNEVRPLTTSNLQLVENQGGQKT